MSFRPNFEAVCKKFNFREFPDPDSTDSFSEFWLEFIHELELLFKLAFKSATFRLDLFRSDIPNFGLTGYKFAAVKLRLVWPKFSELADEALDEDKAERVGLAIN